MAGREIDNNATGVLILIIPIALAIVLLFKAWPALLIVVLLSGAWGLWQRYQLQKWSQQLNPLFHQLILENQGCVTPLDLAMKANLSGRVAKRFLDAKAEEFAAQKQNLEDKGTVYYFLTANTLGRIFDQSTPSSESSSEAFISEAKHFTSPPIPPQKPKELPTSPEAKPEESPVENTARPKEPLPKKHPIFQSLIQSELARRLDVHSSTVLKRRDDPNFSEWSRSRDPEGIAWEYSPDTREFYPLETPTQKS